MGTVSEELITTTEAARVLGVGPSTVKRWADDGLLACVRTAGGHRRFVSDEVQRFKQQGFGSEPSDEVDHWLDLLLSDEADPFQVNAALLQSRGERSSWWEVCATLGPVLDEIGARWARGELAIAEEHVASERIARGLAFVTQSIGVAPKSPSCVLVTAEGDDHTLGLSMVEVCAREAGWNTIWLGRNTPLAEILDTVERRRARIVLISASSSSSQTEELARQERVIGSYLAPIQVPLLLGGRGAWPDIPKYGERINSFHHLNRRLSTLKEARRSSK